MKVLNSKWKLSSLICFVLLMAACQNQPAKQEKAPADTPAPTEAKYEKPRVPDWHKNATIYEVNLRQYTPEGTFKAFEAHLPRLKKMGADILWFMPIHEISKKERKGTLGSPYAVTDYRGVNPEYGTMDDFKHMLKAIHDNGMYCIIDWVPNHTGWDSKWIEEHPDWYEQVDGKITDPINPETGESWGWTDVAELNYDNADMRKAMIDAMAYWIKDIGIDGFRVDVAHGVPVDFWEECSDALYAIEPVYMLAEAEVPAIVNNGAYVMDYGWEMHHLLNEIAATQGVNTTKKDDEKGEKHEKNALDIDKMLAKKDKEYSKGYQMQFTSNHDENSWSGTVFERMGDGYLAFAVLTATFDGMPLLYSGMESGMSKRLEFFEKDAIEWGDFKYEDFYSTLFNLKHKNKALWNGEHGGELAKIPTGNDENIYAFTREKDGDKVVVAINLSAKKQSAALEGSAFAGKYTNVFTKEGTELKEGHKMEMEPWDYVVLSNK